jgi:hypothetical protein
MEQYSIIVSEYNIDPTLVGYDIKRKPSTNVDYYGTNGKEVFIQFKNGVSYIYENVPKEFIEEMYKAESIGSFVSKYLARKFTARKIELKLVNNKPE